MLHNFSQVDDFIWVCDGILSIEDCLLLRAEAMSMLKDVTVLDYEKGPIKDTKSRYAQESLLLKSNYNSQQKIYNSIEKIETIVSNITCLPVENQEYLNIVRYSEGGHYVPHYDFFLKGGEGYDLDIAKGGQRVSSVLFYLNDSYEGGVTQFPKLDNFEIAPRKGRAVYWNNFRDNKPIEKSLHCSLPVEKGFKWIGIVWVREGEYSPRKG